jgi:hypothetical protein
MQLISAYGVCPQETTSTHQSIGRRAIQGFVEFIGLAGVLYDYFGFYAPTFATGIVFNLVNATIIADLVLLWRQPHARVALTFTSIVVPTRMSAHGVERKRIFRDLLSAPT